MSLAEKIINLELRIEALERQINKQSQCNSYEYDVEEEHISLHPVDDTFDMFRIKRELLIALTQSSKRYLDITFENYPEAPRYKVYQNHLMQDVGMSDKARKQLAKIRYLIAEEMSVGDEFECPGCGEPVIKKSYQQRYCGVKKRGSSTCKDFINNWFSVKRAERTKQWIEK
ncbi:hypothetical protein VPFG_00296 [Vibrio phage nt-1]|uniref:Uncharacterized protein n=1 Tax=Vibrio phage nt-1 TaxID=115992 RepID=R9TIT2_9CAUD|nr:hypothetical protein VPFG_00296 [Vibrio phage nt-1]AGN30295.2 hypothetical protein VPFG_00296 [Vibrio phage nt-1]